MQETQVQSLGLEDPLEEGMATHSSILAWRIPIQSYDHQNSVVLAQIQKYRSMQQDRNPRDKPTHL